ncbi:hypothetical protein AWC19_10070 [Mycobacterium palustre]|uniref:Uncharacterized protein n=1 Tax=Mycobacterium palustre TaxID=153971 RepID=A0A1X1ZL57_9MYCO|nr:hypothetical protein AWC19_10070 [Mycobacterium palustre]
MPGDQRFGLVDESQRATGVVESGFDFGLNGVEPRGDCRWCVTAAGECMCCTNPVSRFFGSGPITGECWGERHMRQNRSAQQGVVSLVRSLQRQDEVGLRSVGLLEIEELQSTGKQADFR